TECEALPAPRGGLSQPDETVNIRLLRGDPARRHVLHDRIRPRRGERDAVELGEPDHVAEGVAEPAGMVALEEIRLADGERIDRLEVDLQIVSLGQRPVAT